jgi:hypothetical protein
VTGRERGRGAFLESGKKGETFKDLPSRYTFFLSVNFRREEGQMTRFEGEEHHGWAPDVGTGGSERATEANKKAFDKPPEGEGPGGDENQEGVPPTDTEAQSPLGVGTSPSKGAEEYGAEGDEGRSTEGTKGVSQRPHGGVERGEGAGVDPSEPIDPESPNMAPG